MYLLVDVGANIDGPLLFTCFGGHRKCSIGWAIMPWFQGSGRRLCVKACKSDQTSIIEAREQSWYAPSQWESPLQCNGVSHWLFAHLDWSLRTWSTFVKVMTWCLEHQAINWTNVDCFINWTLSNIFWWIFIQICKLSIHKIAFEYAGYFVQNTMFWMTDIKNKEKPKCSTCKTNQN